MKYKVSYIQSSKQSFKGVSASWKFKAVFRHERKTVVYYIIKNLILQANISPCFILQSHYKITSLSLEKFRHGGHKRNPLH